MKRRLDEDPFAVLFGRSLGRLDSSSSWAPHEIWKSFGQGSSVSPDAREDTRTTDSTDNRGVGIGGGQSISAAEGLQNHNRDKSSREPKATASDMKSATAPEFDIDPITLRKVHKTSMISESDQGATIIPVKTFPGRGLEPSQSKHPNILKTILKSSTEIPNAPSSVSSLSRMKHEDDLKDGPQATSRSSKHSHDPSASRKKEHVEPNTKETERVKQTPSSTWLVDEGFGSTKDRRIENDPKSSPQASQKNLSIPQVVSIFDTNSSSASKFVALPNNIEEDLDLLRPADVRASAGIIKRVKEVRGTEVAQQEVSSEDRSRNMGVSKEVSSEGTTSPVPDPNSSPERTQSKLTYTRFPEKNELESRKQRDRQLIEEIRGIYEDNYGVIDTKHRQKGSASAKDAPLKQDEVLSQVGRYVEKIKANSGGLRIAQSKDLSAKAEDVAPNAGRQPRRIRHEVDPITSGLSEYEQKLGPTAYQFRAGLKSLDDGAVEVAKSSDLKLNFMDIERSSQELARRCKEKERIYQDTAKENNALQKIKRKLDNLIKEQEVAQIDPDQSIKSKELPPSTSDSPVIYKVLAFDPTRQVVSAGTTSSMSTQSTKERILTPAEVIPRLHSPARFLAYFSLLQAEGYEIVSGGGDVLVFKKVRESIETPSRAKDQATAAPETWPPYHSFVNPIDGTTTTGNFASPTGFVNYDSILPPRASEAVEVEEVEADGRSNTISRPPSTDQGEAKITAGGEEKTTDSGTQQQQRNLTMREETMGKRVQKVAKNMVWVGFWVAGCSYLVGVLMEGF